MMMGTTQIEAGPAMKIVALSHAPRVLLKGHRESHIAAPPCVVRRTLFRAHRECKAIAGKRTKSVFHPLSTDGGVVYLTN